ncbi:LysM repeat protein [Agromyces sp. 3263]|uniref:LysM peptidoglycan-binding domain-containing protein n=1 Tax=Agromyces sp. 3263 TaxID=2817750 RepID=UPI00285C6ACF|nr:LysM domain-containing protein [Agromyces sp. 3263]MDR6905733.1 LysM repeat protein [Agromyces sp. 3263]
MVAASAAFAVGATIVLSGCVAEPAPAPVTITATATVTATPTPTPEAAPPPAEPAPVPVPEPVPNAPAPVVEWGPAYDTGAIPGASGTPALDGNGVPASYVVVSGDSFFDIAQRFELPQQQLLRMNPQIHDFGETVYIGDVINLDWTKTG